MSCGAPTLPSSSGGRWCRAAYQSFFFFFVMQVSFVVMAVLLVGQHELAAWHLQGGLWYCQRMHDVVSRVCDGHSPWWICEAVAVCLCLVSSVVCAVAQRMGTQEQRRLCRAQQHMLRMRLFLCDARPKAFSGEQWTVGSTSTRRDECYGLSQNGLGRKCRERQCTCC